MSDQESKEGVAETAKKGGVLPWVVVGTVAATVGAAVPMALTSLPSAHAVPPGSTESAPSTKVATDLSSMVFMPFGEATVNLDEGRLNRYLHIKLALHVRKNDELTVKKAIDEKQPVLQNWMLSHLADKDLNDIRGKAGQNMLRREIRDHFNSVLFPDNYERIYDVLFEEFNVQ
ncbi:flagellar basal body-associated FliL family protein [Planctomicrobium sp. SH664]|uniref:flagellar basal body-associated FliL family protein n=1 Tax=Planctomicrobium sp. SH664 TaxID=3448125 RepID=UPI003F5B4A9C